MDSPWTIRSILQWTTQDFEKRGIESARVDAELLIARGLGIDRVGLYLDLDRPLKSAERTAVRELVTRRREREPVAYILGHKDFYGRRFSVDARVLVPRPDTETLVEEALKRIDENAAVRVLDVGTGSGIVAITIALERPEASVYAVDASPAALVVARANAERLGAGDRIRFVESDLFGALQQGEAFDAVVSNPPYITDAELQTLEPEVLEHEPREALSGGADGLVVVRRLLAEGQTWVRPGGFLMMEVGASQARAVRDLADRDVWLWQAAHKDLNGIERVVHFRRA